MTKTLVGIVLDMSGSMIRVVDPTISGYNEYIETLKQAKDSETEVCLTVFNSAKIDVGDVKPLSEISPLTKQTYAPQELTPLYDAIAATIDKIDELGEEVDKILFVIITDGYENASRKYNREEIFRMIREHEENQNWDFVYIGANQDAYASGMSMGVRPSYTSGYSSTPQGTAEMFAGLANSTQTYSQADSSPEEFFDKETKKKIEPSS